MSQANHKMIASLVPAGAKVLDIGCGEGALLELLEAEKQADARGMELEAARVAAAVARGLSVVQGDADLDLQYYPDGCFDVAVLGHTLQAMKQPKEVLGELLRIAQTVIVSIPNFGHISTRWYLFSRGRMPVTSALSYQWYETPNIHFCTIRDFYVLCRDLDAQVKEARFVGASGALVSKPFANLFAEQGVFALTRRKAGIAGT